MTSFFILINMNYITHCRSVMACAGAFRGNKQCIQVTTGRCIQLWHYSTGDSTKRSSILQKRRYRRKEYVLDFNS